MEDIRNQIEAILFSCGRKISLDEIATLGGVGSVGIIKKALIELQEDYTKRQSPLMVVEEGGEWKLTVHEKYLNLVRKINPLTELSKTLMETLAVIAWKQPMLQADVIKIRTNKAYDDITELEKMGFLIKEKYGRTFMLKLTQKFFDYFDLRDEAEAREKFKEFKEELKEDQKRMNGFSQGSEQGTSETPQ